MLALNALTQPAQSGDATGGDPLSNKDIPVSVKAGVVRMHELAGKPFTGVVAHSLYLLGDALDVVPELCDHLILFIEQGYPCMQFRHQQEIFP